MVRKGLVSIVSPCYNGACYVHRLLDSVLLQIYESIEMIVIDDGSTDDTKAVIELYVDRFKSRGYTLTYLHQQHSGQSSAINKALKLVTGEFLIWPDSDDYFTAPDSISKFVSAFCSLNNDYGIVRSYVNNITDDGNFLCIRKPKVNKDKLFEEFFTGLESIAVAGSYMVRMSAFDYSIPGRNIYTIDYPQNWQLLLPVLYHFKCHTIKEPLHTIVVRKNSHSTNNKPYSLHLTGFDGYARIINNTIDAIDMPDTEKNRYKAVYRRYSLFEKLTYAINYYQAQDSRRFAKELIDCGGHVSSSKKFKIALLSTSPLLLKFFNNIYFRYFKLRCIL